MGVIYRKQFANRLLGCTTIITGLTLLLSNPIYADENETKLNSFVSPNESQVMANQYIGVRSVHRFSPELLRRIVTPNRERGEDLIQFPFVPAALVDKLLKSFPKEDVARQMQLQYGLNKYNVSYIPNDPKTFAEYGGYRQGVSPNCFLCHSSYIGNTFIPGIGNTRVDLRSFLHDLVFKDFGKNYKAVGDLVTSKFPHILFRDLNQSSADSDNVSVGQRLINRVALLGSVFGFILDPKLQSNSAGHSNPWGFAEYLFNWRDDDMNYIESPKGRGLKAKEFVMDPMPWWQLKYKNYINWDGLIKKSPRVIVQASLSPGRNGAEIRAMDNLFSNIFDEIQKMEPPQFPKIQELNVDQIRTGELIFNKSCAECHGKHSENGVYNRDPIKFRETYNDEIVKWDHIKTDPTRMNGIDFKYLRQLQKSWLGHYGDPEFQFRWNSEGYQVPPLWGIWASAPYFHNGSIPTLRAVLFPEQRPSRWKLIEPKDSAETPYDFENIGLSVETSPDVQSTRTTKIYDTTLDDGRSNQGHEEIFEKLSKKDRLDVLEYLKTL